MSATATTAAGRRSRRGAASRSTAAVVRDGVVPVVIVVAIILPFFFDSGSSFMDDCDARARLRRDGARPEHRRRLRRPARPRLRRVLRDRRLHDGLVRLGLLLDGQRREGHPHRRRAASPASLPGIHLNFLIVLVVAVDLRDDRGHDHRPADAAPARRLHRDRDARLRRDHRPHRGQRRRAEDRSGQPLNLTTGRQGITPVDKIDLPFLDPFTSLNLRPWYWVGARRSSLVVLFINFRLRDSRLGRAWIALREDEVAAASMGVPTVQDEAAGLRAPAPRSAACRRVPRLVPQHRQRRPVRVLVLDLRARDGHPRRPRLDLGRRRSARSCCRSSTTT